MRNSRIRWFWLTAACVGGTLFQALPTGCSQFFAYQAISSLDFCAVLNCGGGAFFNFCSPVQILLDCPA
ncbi:MAG: hypothetical protein JNG88_15040 [Phycisphaerales bacterium]|nr:hypothetical protein [Phycisphaerales bacterium]